MEQLVRYKFKNSDDYLVLYDNDDARQDGPTRDYFNYYDPARLYVMEHQNSKGRLIEAWSFTSHEELYTEIMEEYLDSTAINSRDDIDWSREIELDDYDLKESK